MKTAIVEVSLIFPFLPFHSHYFGNLWYPSMSALVRFGLKNVCHNSGRRITCSSKSPFILTHSNLTSPFGSSSSSATSFPLVVSSQRFYNSFVMAKSEKTLRNRTQEQRGLKTKPLSSTSSSAAKNASTTLINNRTSRLWLYALGGSLALLGIAGYK